MRKLGWVLILLLLAGCSTTRENITSDGGYSYYGIDFRPYAEQGFLITTEGPQKDYNSVGLIEVNLQPEVKKISFGEHNRIQNEDEPEFTSTRVYNGNQVEYYAVEILDIQKAIDGIYELASEWGANAIFNLDINSTFSGDLVTKETITVSGLAVVLD
ncbi:hypothetical protein [Gracilimonas sp.]|uniref:hypothetical protein n=1 Tax=Gracilimonas sp. TaxID=1974203 RepID=UPI002870F504|nr:hypothetical protein [Gracilimonas sp.]